MYVLVEVSPPSRDAETLLMLVRSEYPTAARRNNTWSVVSTTPGRYLAYDEISKPYWRSDVACFFCGQKLYVHNAVSNWFWVSVRPITPKSQENKPVALSVMVSENGEEQIWFVTVGWSSNHQLSS